MSVGFAVNSLARCSVSFKVSSSASTCVMSQPLLGVHEPLVANASNLLWVCLTGSTTYSSFTEMFLFAGVLRHFTFLNEWSNLKKRKGLVAKF